MSDQRPVTDTSTGARGQRRDRQEHASTRAVVLPHLRAALASQVVVEQAKGLLRQRLGMPVGDAFMLLRTFARATGTHLSEPARRLMSESDSRPSLIAALSDHAPSDGTLNRTT